MPVHRDYSHVPLTRKLGIREGSVVVLDGAPEGLEAWLAPLPAGVEMTTHRCAAQGDVDVALAFATEMERMASAVVRLAPLLAVAGGLWLCSPRRAAGVATDIDFDGLQALGLGAGLVDNKVARISDVFTGVRFVRRRRDRAATAR